MRLASLLLAIVLIQPTATFAAPTMPTTPMAAQSEQSTRWVMRLSHNGRAWFHEDVWLTLRPDGTARMVVIGPASQAADGQRNGQSLEFDSAGVRLSVRLEGSRMSGRWSRGLARGEISGSMVAPELEPAGFPALFDAIGSLLASRYYDPTFGGRDWPTYLGRHRPAAIAARNEAEFTLAVRAMLDELGISHLGFFRNDRPAALPAAEVPQGSVLGWLKPRPAVGYLRIKDFVQSPAEMARLGRAFVELADTSSIIIDLRENGGGNIHLAMRLADHLLPDKRSLGLFVTQGGLTAAGVTSIAAFPAERASVYDGYDVGAFVEQLRSTGAVRLSAGGRAFTRQRAIYVLIDRRSGSAAEAVAAALQDEGATVVGDRSAGAMLVGAKVEVAPQWTLRFPEADFRTEKGQILERVGVQPDVRVDARRAYDAALDLIDRAARRG